MKKKPNWKARLLLTAAALCILGCAAAGLAHSRSQAEALAAETRAHRALREAYSELMEVNADLKAANQENTEELESLQAMAQDILGRLDALDETEDAIREELDLPAEAREQSYTAGETDGVLYTQLSSLLADVTAREESLSAIRTQLEDEAARIPDLWPVPSCQKISSGFGGRRFPLDNSSYEFHQAIDIDGEEGCDIVAAGRGTVTLAQEYYGYGLCILIDHGNGYVTRYSHCSTLLTEVGEQVEKGQVIACMGSTGWSTGTHLDFRLYTDGEAVDPLTLLEREA